MGTKFRDKTVFVAGGSTGINLGIAEAFAREGAHIAILSRSQDKIDAALDRLREFDPNAVGYSADVRDAGKIASEVESLAARAGGIDVLVSGAAGNFQAFAADLSPNGFRTVVEIDLLGTYNVLKAAYPFLRRPGGCVINISAPQSWVPLERQVHACAAKAGVDQVTRTLALEWGPEGIRVNSISPGAIGDTEGMKRLGPGTATVLGAIPLGRMGAVRDIAQAALFLASDDASYISGVVLPVDGGCGVTGTARAFNYSDHPAGTAG